MMGHKILIALALVFLVSSEFVAANTNKVVCYFASWAQNRTGDGNFQIDNIDPFLCTHVIYTFLNINPDGSVKISNPDLDINHQSFIRFNALKKRNPNLKTLIAIGGWNAESVPFSNVAVDANKRATLIKSAVTLLQTYGFDGFDLDWEYPNQRGGVPADVGNLATLAKEFREEFDKHGYILTAAVAAVPASVDLSYNVPALSKYLDIINVMAYDMHNYLDGATGQNAPLYGSSNDVSDYQRTLNVDASIRGWISRGADPQKLALGLGAYGRSYTLSNAANNALGSTSWNPGYPGPYTQEGGMLGYNEICEKQLEGGWTVKWDDVQKNPYAYNGDQWVGYDNPKSIGIKVAYAQSLNLGGVMLWSIDTEDFRSKCGSKFPLLNAVRTALGTSNEILDPQEPDQTEQLPQENDPQQPGEPEQPAQGGGSSNEVSPDGGSSNGETSDNPCTKIGYVVDSEDCNVFYYCMQDGTKLVPLRQNCPGGLAFDGQTCNYRSLVNC